MSTRSTIAVHNPNTGRVTQVYCHFDGYLEGVGQTLLDHYHDADSADNLMVEGDMSSLGNTVDETVYYGRDRGEKWFHVCPDVYDSIDDYMNRANREEYNYLFTDNEWKLYEHRVLVPLKKTVKNPVEPSIDEWKRQVANNTTVLGYTEWLETLG